MDLNFCFRAVIELTVVVIPDSIRTCYLYLLPTPNLQRPDDDLECAHGALLPTRLNHPKTNRESKLGRTRSSPAWLGNTAARLSVPARAG